MSVISLPEIVVFVTTSYAAPGSPDHTAFRKSQEARIATRRDGVAEPIRNATRAAVLTSRGA
jgi:hypothetical protein